MITHKVPKSESRHDLSQRGCEDFIEVAAVQLLSFPLLDLHNSFITKMNVPVFIRVQIMYNLQYKQSLICGAMPIDSSDPLVRMYIHHDSVAPQSSRAFGQNPFQRETHKQTHNRQTSEIRHCNRHPETQHDTQRRFPTERKAM